MTGLQPKLVANFTGLASIMFEMTHSYVRLSFLTISARAFGRSDLGLQIIDIKCQALPVVVI
jgi:hypothetical protein